MFLSPSIHYCIEDLHIGARNKNATEHFLEVLKFLHFPNSASKMTFSHGFFLYPEDRLISHLFLNLPYLKSFPQCGPTPLPSSLPEYPPPPTFMDHGLLEDLAIRLLYYYHSPNQSHPYCSFFPTLTLDGFKLATVLRFSPALLGEVSHHSFSSLAT